MSRIVFPHSSLNAVNSLQPTFSGAQLSISALETSFTQQACNGRSLLGMMAGSFAFRIGRLAVLESFSSLALMRNPFIAPAARALAFTSALAGEVTVFRGVNQALSPEVISPEASFLNPQSWMSTFVDFLSLKTLAPLGARNVFFGHISQNLGMMAGHYATSSLGLTPQTEGSFAQQFFHASAMNLQMGVGIVLGMKLTGARLQSLERSIETRSGRVSETSFESLPRLFQKMHADGLDGNSVQSHSAWKIPTEVLGVNIEDASVTFGEVWHSFRMRNRISVQSFCRNLNEIRIYIKDDTVDVYRKFPDRVVEPKLLRAIHLLYGEDLRNLVYLASRPHLSSPQAHDLSVTAEGPLCLYPHWMPQYLNRLAAAGRRPHSLQYRILEALTKTPGARKAEEIVSGTDLTKDQLLKYLGGVNTPEADKIPEVAKALRITVREVIEGINEDHGFTPLLDRLGMRHDIYFIVKGQSADAEWLKEFSDLGIPALRRDLRSYVRYRLWRAHKECGGGTMSLDSRSLSWKGKDRHFLSRYLADRRPFMTEHLSEAADLLRRLNQNPIEVFAPYREELGILAHEFLRQIGMPENIRNLFSVILASKPEGRTALLRQGAWPEQFRDIFPEAFSESDACLVLDTEDINAACSLTSAALSTKAAFLRSYPETFFLLPLKNPHTGKYFRIHLSRLAPLLGREKLHGDFYEQAPGIRVIDEKARIAEIAEKIGTWDHRTGESLERNEEVDLYFIWRHSEVPVHREKADEVLMAAYREYIFKLTLNTVSIFGLNISEHLATALSEANLGFHKALQTFNPDLGIRFMTYIIHEQNWIRKTVGQWCRGVIRQKIRERQMMDEDRLEVSERDDATALSVDPALNTALLMMNQWFQTKPRPDLWQTVFLGRFLDEENLENIATAQGVSIARVRLLEAKIRAKARRVFSNFQDRD